MYCSGLLGTSLWGGDGCTIYWEACFCQADQSSSGETQVLNGRPVSSGLTKALSVPALGEVVRRLDVATSAYGSLNCTVRDHWAACSWLHTEVFTALPFLKARGYKLL